MVFDARNSDFAFSHALRLWHVCRAAVPNSDVPSVSAPPPQEDSEAYLHFTALIKESGDRPILYISV
jgi:hypothetical protein